MPKIYSIRVLPKDYSNNMIYILYFDRIETAR